MSFTDDLEILKEDSLFKAHLRHGRGLFRDLSRLGEELVERVDDQLSRPQRVRAEDVNTDERTRTAEALKRVRFERELDRIFRRFSGSIIPIRDAYHRELKTKIAEAFNKSTPSFYKMTPRFPKSEFSRLTRMVNGRDLRSTLSILRFKTEATLENTIIDAYKPIPQIRDVYLRDFRRRLRGTMVRLVKIFEMITRDLFAALYEQDVTNTMNFINGRAGR